MSKLVIVLAVAAFAQILNAEETPVAKELEQTKGEIAPSAQIRSSGLFDNFPGFGFQIPEIDPEATKNLKPDGPNSDVQGEYSSQSSSTKIVNGQVVEDTSSQTKIKNQNGTVTEESSSH